MPLDHMMFVSDHELMVERGRDVIQLNCYGLNLQEWSSAAYWEFFGRNIVYFGNSFKSGKHAFGC
jgi:hypothetical protein